LGGSHPVCDVPAIGVVPSSSRTADKVAGALRVIDAGPVYVSVVCSSVTVNVPLNVLPRN
jgi:hypothetical protein